MQNKRYIKIVSSILIVITIFTFSFVLAADDSVYVWSNGSEPLSKETSSKLNTNEENMNRMITTNAEAENNLKLESGGAILIEQHSGQILYEHNPHEKLRPASVTKVMSILLIMEALDSKQISLTDKVPCTEDAAEMGGSQIWLDVREELTVDEMLKAICVVSANDCVVAMAEFIAGSEEMFVQQMNEKATSLGMNDTHFVNCHGIDEDGHFTSAYDISLMSRELLTKYPEITKYTTIWMDSLRDGQSELTNTNKLVRTYDGCTGLKTGSTSLALYNLSASATRNDLSLIAVVMKGPTSEVRFSEAKKLLDYGFTNYTYAKTSTAGEVVQSIEVQKGAEKELNLVYESDSGRLVKNTENTSDIISNVTLNENITAPINKRRCFGKCSVLFK